MAASGAFLFPVDSSPIIRRGHKLALRKLKSRWISSLTRPFKATRTTAIATTEPETTSTRTNSSNSGRIVKEDEAESIASKGIRLLEEEQRTATLKDYVEESKAMIEAADGGPPRWFSPLDGCSRLTISPLLLFLPGIDGLGLGLILNHQRLGRLFDIWCLHIPVMDRTPFTDLVKMVERTVRSEHHRSLNRPIYLVGESLGACLALAVAALNPGIDLVLILANPGTSFSRSPLQPLLPMLEPMLSQLPVGLPFSLDQTADHALKAAFDGVVKGLPLLQSVGKQLTEDAFSMLSYLSVLAYILPGETLLWKLKMLKSASTYVNSRLHAIEARILILSSGKDQLLPSHEEGERLRQALSKCELRKFDDSGHFLFLDREFDLVTTIKACGYFRRGKHIDYVSDYIPPTSEEFKKVLEQYRWFNILTGAVMLSTLDDGKIVRGLSGIPQEGPVLFVGYHMLLGTEKIPLVTQILTERNILVRGMAHPMMFARYNDGGNKLPDLSMYDSVRLMGAVPVTATNFFKLFSSKSHVLLYPGGMREALHRKGEQYKLFWPEQSEFVRMAARFGVKIVPFGAVGEDDFAEVVFDYNDLMRIPYFRDEIGRLTSEAVKLRIDSTGEVANQDVHLPGMLPKFPGRFYYYFGKPIETEGRKNELSDRNKSHEAYLQVKSEVERCIAYLKEKRENDPYRNLLTRLSYQATHGFTSEVPTFDI